MHVELETHITNVTDVIPCTVPYVLPYFGFNLDSTDVTNVTNIRCSELRTMLQFCGLNSVPLGT